MLKVPEQYKVGVNISLKDFIQKDLKAEQKKRIKNSIKKVELTYQIAGEAIPSVVNNEYRCQVIQFYDIEIHSMKDATFLAGIYQNLIKSLCVIRLHDSMNEAYSFSIKRLNQTDNSQIVMEQSVITEYFPVGLPDASRDRLFSFIEYPEVKNKTDKLNYYREIYTKSYIISNAKSYSGTEGIILGDIWYDANKAGRMFYVYKRLVDKRTLFSKATTNAEKTNIIREIKENITMLDEEKY